MLNDYIRIAMKPIITGMAIIAVTLIIFMIPSLADDASGIENAITITETPKAQEEVTDEKVCNIQDSYYSRIIKDTSSDDWETTRWITSLEAHDEPYDGIKAVVEVICNRAVNPKWNSASTIIGVLSEKGQFATWKYLSHPYNHPDERETDAIAEVLDNGYPATLEKYVEAAKAEGKISQNAKAEDYVFFSRGTKNGVDHIKIGHHYFGRMKK